MSVLAGNLTVVCHQIRSPDNLGAIARLMANFGFERLVLSDPVTHAFGAAEKLAVGAESVLQGLAVAKDLAEAVAPSVYCCGTTSRDELKGRVALSPESAVEKLLQESRRGPVALVFGGEKRGLSDDELGWCTDVVVIPTRGPQPSMNLSQAVGVMLYLCARAQLPEAPSLVVAGARLASIHALEARMEEVLLGSGFLNPQAPEHVRRELSRSLVRAQLSQREAELWLSAFAHLRRNMMKDG